VPLLRCLLGLLIAGVPAQFVADILQVRKRADKFRADGPELFSPDFVIVSPITHEFGEDGPENSDKSTTKSKPRG
jgi:hypothetical protein